MLQEILLLYSLFQRMLCHLLIAKRNIEHILKRRAILNYFWLFLQYLFSCIRIFFVGGKIGKMYFSLVRKTYFFPFCTLSMFKQNFKSNMMMFHVTVSACCLCCLKDGCVHYDPPSLCPPPICGGLDQCSQ